MVESIKSCEDVWLQISNYIDGEVDSGLRAQLEEHIKGCKRCASVLAGTRNVIQLYGDERMLEVPAGFSRRLEKRLALNAPVPVRRWSSWSAWLVPVAALVLIAGAVLLTNSLTFRNFIQSRHAQPGNNVPPDLVVVVSDGSKVFHVAGCPFIHDKASERTMTAKEATREGYTPCTRCLRQYLKTGLAHHEQEIAESSQDEDSEVEVLNTRQSIRLKPFGVTSH
jgi:hypothetical protein